MLYVPSETGGHLHLLHHNGHITTMQRSMHPKSGKQALTPDGKGLQVQNDAHLASRS